MKYNMSLVEYLKGLYQNLCNECVDLGYDYAECTNFIYKFLLDADFDFNKFDKDYYNCEEFENIDRKDCMKKLMFATHYIVEFYNNCGKLPEDQISEIVSSYQMDDMLFDNLFENEEVGLEIVDNFSIYMEFTKAKRKLLALELTKCEDFQDICELNEYLKILYLIDINLDVTEEELLIENVVECYDNFGENNYELYDYSDISDRVFNDKEGLNKIKKDLILKGLINDLENNKKSYYIKHYFSMMIKNIYTDIYYSKKCNLDNSSVDDNKFYDEINENKITYDELFNRFINNQNFSSYIIGTFYLNNIEKDSIDLENNNEVYINDKLDEKVKKYFI